MSWYGSFNRGDRGRLQHFLPNWSYHIYYSGKKTKVDCIWKGHLSAWFSSGFEVPHTCSIRAVSVLKQGVKCCNMVHITGSVETLPSQTTGKNWPNVGFPLAILALVCSCQAALGQYWVSIGNIGIDNILSRDIKSILACHWHFWNCLHIDTDQ